MIKLPLVSALLIFAAYVQADSREDFVNNILPDKYPQLIRYLEDKGRLPVSWVSQTGEEQSQTLELTKNGSVVIKTMMWAGPATNMNKPVQVTMWDRDQDTRLDHIEYKMEGQQPQSISAPTDDSSLFLWDTALAITMKYSKCCPK